jgi:hypothetical protein
MDKIVIPLDNGYKIIVEQNSNSEFNKEIFVGIETESGMYYQDLAIVRPTYSFEEDKVKYASDKFEILVFGDEKREDYTEKFIVPLYKEDEDD